MGPKIEAVCRFVEATGKLAAIGQLSDAQALLDVMNLVTLGPGLLGPTTLLAS